MALSEKVIPLIERNFTHRLYARRKGTFFPIPGLFELVCVYLGEWLPVRYYKYHGFEGVIRIGYYWFSFLRRVGRTAALIVRVLRTIVVSLKAILRICKRAAKIVLTTDRKGYSVHLKSQSSLLENKVLVTRTVVQRDSFTVTCKRIGRLTPRHLFFVHLYPEHEGNASDGFISLDFWPTIPCEHWVRGSNYTFTVELNNVPIAYYRLKFGMYQADTFVRLKVNGTNDNSIDLGWVRVGSGGDSVRE